MFKGNKIVVLLVLTSILLFPLVAYAKVGSFNQILGTVEQLKEGKPPGILPKIKDAVSRLDVINTQEQSRAEVILLDNSILTVAPGSHITIEHYLYEGKTKRNIVVNLLHGFLDVVVTKHSSEGEFLIKTPTAIMGIRGSWSKVGVSGGNALFAQVAGTATVRGAGATAGTATTLHSGMITAAVNHQLTTPTQLTPQNLAALNQASFTGLPRGMNISPNIQQTFRTIANFKPSAPPPAAAKTVTKTEAKLMNIGVEAKIQALMRDKTLPAALVSAAIATTIADSVHVATTLGVNKISAVGEATQAATQGALRAGVTLQQIASIITPVATQTAMNLGVNAQNAVTAVTQGVTQGAIQSGITTQQVISTVNTIATQTALNVGLTATEANTAISAGTQEAVQAAPAPMFSPATDVAPPAAPSGATGTGGTGGGGGGGGTASPSR